ncbi:hypothetical protein Bpfe_014977 [Biomphalaria pfeifferi]|uniref:Uncharacterized protein n=1 Tax=Biomphalaria pfeifferi TaxID=112525 RepID=A0AAD8BJ07_BIOPF|nr:hypothetical protein Bpfe_014977 [Biomphalaria pfeifferi]
MQTFVVYHQTCKRLEHTISPAYVWNFTIILTDVLSLPSALQTFEADLHMFRAYHQPSKRLELTISHADICSLPSDLHMFGAYHQPCRRL